MSFLDEFGDEQIAGDEGFLGQVGTENIYVNHGDLAQLAVVAIQPSKRELDALGDIDPAIDPRMQVPWLGGISLQLLATKVEKLEKDPDNPDQNRVVTYNLIEADESGEPKFPYGYRGIRQYERLYEGDIKSGMVRVYDSNQHLMSIGFPKGFEDMTAKQRFNFWWEMISRKFGANRLHPGHAFWVYLKETKKDGYQYPFRNFYKGFKDEATQATLEATFEVDTNSYTEAFLRKALALATKLGEAAKREKEDFPG